MVSIRKTNVKMVPVTAEVDGRRVIVGEAEVVDTKDGLALAVRLDLDTPEGLNISSMINRGMTNAISVSSSNADLINKVAERNKQHKKDNPDDGTAGNE